MATWVTFHRPKSKASILVNIDHVQRAIFAGKLGEHTRLIFDDGTSVCVKATLDQVATGLRSGVDWIPPPSARVVK